MPRRRPVMADFVAEVRCKLFWPRRMGTAKSEQRAYEREKAEPATRAISDSPSAVKPNTTVWLGIHRRTLSGAGVGVGASVAWRWA
jgi:hypothetical protein